MKKRDRIISSVMRCSAQYLERAHKFVIELPKLVNKAVVVKEEIGNSLTRCNGKRNTKCKDCFPGYSEW